MNLDIKETLDKNTTNFITVAFASSDNKYIDAHFGSVKQFYIYKVNIIGFNFLRTIKILNKDTDKTISLLKECDIVYFLDIGATAAAKIIHNGIFPIKYKELVSINKELHKLVKMLNEKPPPFIKKIIQKKLVV